MHKANPLTGFIFMKIEIKFSNFFQKSANMRRSFGNRGEIIRSALRFFSNVEANHRQVPVGRKDRISGIGVVPDICLGAVRYIAVTRCTAAHDHHMFDMVNNRRIMIQCRRQIG